MSFCDTDVISQVLEDLEAFDLLTNTLRQRILKRLDGMGGEPIEQLQKLFEEVDVSKDNNIS